jgi:N-acetylmuramoyl-L-alanine amidase
LKKIDRSRRFVRLGALALLMAIPVLPAWARGVHGESWARERFVRAERIRETLNLKLAKFRTREDYQDAIDAYRRVYYSAPSSSKADSSAYAVAQLLVEMGRQFNDMKVLRSGISQYEFVRREYPYSKHRFDALYAIADIYKFDLNDAGEARSNYQEFLRRYPRHHLADDAKAAIAELDQSAAKENAKSLAKKVNEAKKQTTARDVNSSQDSDSGQNAGDAAEESGGDNSEAAVAETEKPSGTPHVMGIRHWTTPDYTRVAIDLDDEIKFDSQRIDNPKRIFFDLHNVSLAANLNGKRIEVDDGLLKKIRVAQFRRGRARVVLEVEDKAEYSAFYVEKPSRLIIDVHGKNYVKSLARNDSVEAPVTTEPKPARQAAATSEAKPSRQRPASVSNDRDAGDPTVTFSAGAPPPVKNGEPRPAAQANSDAQPIPKKIVEADDDDDDANGTSAADKDANTAKTSPVAAKVKSGTNASSASSGRTVARSRSKRKTSDGNNDEVATFDTPDLKTEKKTVATVETAASADEAPDATRPPSPNTVKASAKRNRTADIEPVVHEAVPTASGDRSLIRALGLKIGRIVIDPGHGGHDTGTIGPNGLQEKDLVLDVGRRLGKLLEARMGADVVYTRQDDTFIPLETRTAIANQEQADLFVSIHANSSHDRDARGVETYYLNFTSNADALEVAARENAVSDKSIHELQDLVKKIALKEKIEESREFAADVQRSLHTGLSAKSPGLRDRGVKKAPFIVLIGANMPSILAEISFVSNPTDERKLGTGEYRQRIAESLYKGISKYVGGLSGVKVASRMSKAESP